MNHAITRHPSIVKTIFFIMGFMLLILGLMVNKLVNPPVLSVEQFKQRGVFLFDTARRIKDFELQDHHGDVFNKEDLQGKWGLAFFGFTNCPDVCPTTLAMLNQVVGQIDVKDIQDTTQVMLFSVDPARDTVETLSTYMPFFNTEFIGVSGNFLQILAFSANLNAPFHKVLTGDTYTVDHSAYIFLINPHGDYQGFFKPPFDVEDLKQNYLAVREKYQGLM